MTDMPFIVAAILSREAAILRDIRSSLNSRRKAELKASTFMSSLRPALPQKDRGMPQDMTMAHNIPFWS